jgi:hypothetical protein
VLHSDFRLKDGKFGPQDHGEGRATVTDIHLVLGIAVIASNLLAGGWGGISWLRNHPSVSFWYMLRAAQVAVVIQVGLGALLLAQGRESADELHYVYGVLPLLVSLLAELVRAGAADQELGEREIEELDRNSQRAVALAIVRREMGIMAVSALVIFGLALRAAGTSAEF